MDSDGGVRRIFRPISQRRLSSGSVCGLRIEEKKFLNNKARPAAKTPQGALYLLPYQASDVLKPVKDCGR